VRVYVDRDKCVASGTCTLSAPGIFEQDEDGVAVVVMESPSADQVTAALSAARACPAEAIWLEDE
jgi:ferredoxin